MSAMLVLSTDLILYPVYSSARLFFGRGALMAKALGTTPEEEHRPGMAPLARVSSNFSYRSHNQNSEFLCRSANKRASWTVIHGYRTPGGDRVVQGLPPTRLCTVRQSRLPHRNPPRGASHAAPLRPAGAVPAQRGTAAAQARSDDGHAEGRADAGEPAQAV